MTTVTKDMKAPAKGKSVAERAYAIWEAEGRPEGRDMAHWLKAEAEARVQTH